MSVLRGVATVWIWACVPLVVMGACRGDPDDGHEHDHGDDDDDDHTGDDDDDDVAEPALAWIFSTDAATNSWYVTLVDPTSPGEAVAAFAVDDLAALSGPNGNDAGPAWGDAVPSTDHRRVFVNATSVDRVAVFEADTRALEAVLDVGERPLHLYNPNHGAEIWTHTDGDGSFYVIDQTSLAVDGPVVAALGGTGHGKLLYAGELGTDYFATNTSDPGAWPVDGAGRVSGDLIGLCGMPCEDDETLTCGGTHDKGYNPVMDYAFFECSGIARGHFAFVDAATHAVVHDLVPMSGAVAATPDHSYILVIDARAEQGQVKVWDTAAPGHDGVAFDAVLDIDGAPSARGAAFRMGSGGWEAWVPQTEGTKLAIVELSTFEVELVEIGTLTAPPGAGHFNRLGALGDGWFVTYNDQGIVIVDVQTRQVTQGAPVQGAIARMAVADPAGHR